MKKAVKMWLIFVTAFLIGAALSEMMPSLLYAYQTKCTNTETGCKGPCPSPTVCKRIDIGGSGPCDCRY